MVKEEPKMEGIARYLASVELFWSYAIPTACAGIGFIFFNPDFWVRIPEETRITVMAHEVWHLILKHNERGEGFDPEDHNKAADHVINLRLEEMGFTFDGTEPYKDPQYKGMSTEQIYDVIHEEKKKNGGSGKSGHIPKSVIDDLVKAAADAIAGDDHYSNVPKQEEINDANLEDLAVSLGKETGNKHIELEITGRRIAITGITYEEIFENYLIDPISGARRSYMRPNRRQHGNSGATFKLPGRVVRPTKKNRLAHLVYALDVSGSITKQTAQTFHDSVRTIKELLNPALLTVIFFDTEIKLVKTFTDHQAYTKIQVKAGGCTCLDEVYAYGAKVMPQAMVIFTDLCVTIPPQPPWHTIWLVPEKHRETAVANLYGDIYVIPKPHEES